MGRTTGTVAEVNQRNGHLDTRGYAEGNLVEQSSREELWLYDVFISYARFDENLHGTVAKLIDGMQTRFREITGWELRVFVDVKEVRAANLWKDRILDALERSAIFIAVYTPSYLTSEWCCREWDTFLALESSRKEWYQLLPYESLIFPVIADSSTSHPPQSLTPQSQRRWEEIHSRQAILLDPALLTSTDFARRVDGLVADIAAVLQKVMQPDFNRMRSSMEGAARSKLLNVTTPLVSTYPGSDPRKLRKLLVDAQAVTIIGVYNSWLAEPLEAAILEKRGRAHGQETFWDRLNIVFLSDELLTHVDDHLSIEFPNRAEAFLERMQRAASVKRRLMSLLLRLGVPGRWALYSYPYILPLTGNLFTMADGKRVVQLAMTRSSRAEQDYLFIDFVDRVDQLFESTFREIVDSSHEEHELVLVGIPVGSTEKFVCRGTRFRRSVLVEGKNTADWLPAVLVITWRHGSHGPEPLLQMNSPQTSTREMGKISHVSGYINQQDQITGPHVGGAATAGAFELSPDTPLNALKRELASDFGIQSLLVSPTLVGTERFFYPDKENLFFYIYQQELESTQRFSPDVQIFPWTLAELMSVRHGQALTNAITALTSSLTDQQRRRAVRLARLNLTVHGDSVLAEELESVGDSPQRTRSMIQTLETRAAQTRVYKYLIGREIAAEGLAGLQYRAFFSCLLPTYASIGVADADRIQAEIEGDPKRREAADELTRLYRDDNFMTSVPIEV